MSSPSATHSTASPPTSGIPPAGRATAGRPAWNASSSGTQNPSCSDSDRKTLAVARPRPARSGSEPVSARRRADLRHQRLEPLRVRGVGRRPDAQRAVLRALGVSGRARTRGSPGPGACGGRAARWRAPAAPPTPGARRRRQSRRIQQDRHHAGVRGALRRSSSALNAETAAEVAGRDHGQLLRPSCTSPPPAARRARSSGRGSRCGRRAACAGAARAAPASPAANPSSGSAAGRPPRAPAGRAAGSGRVRPGRAGRRACRPRCPTRRAALRRRAAGQSRRRGAPRRR